MLARYGYRVTVCESHYALGGAAHSFTVKGHHFDSGPSFFAGLSGELADDVADLFVFIMMRLLSAFLLHAMIESVTGNSPHSAHALSKSTKPCGEDFNNLHARFRRREHFQSSQASAECCWREGGLCCVRQSKCFSLNYHFPTV